MNPQRLRMRAHSGFGLIEILVVCVLIIVLSSSLAVLYFGHGSGDKANETVHTPIGKANTTVCQSNLTQLRQAITMEQTGDPDSKFPASLHDLKGLPSEFIVCPDGHEPYAYDPATGTVHCVHPGHENL